MRELQAPLCWSCADCADSTSNAAASGRESKADQLEVREEILAQETRANTCSLGK